MYTHPAAVKLRNQIHEKATTAMQRTIVTNVIDDPHYVKRAFLGSIHLNLHLGMYILTLEEAHFNYT